MNLRTIHIISGGQTGADRAALDFALEYGFSHGGWCPRGRLAEDGAIPDNYALAETPSRKYAQRTEWNVRDSDATALFTIGPRLSGGTALTMEIASRLGKPTLHLCREVVCSHEPGLAIAANDLRMFLKEHGVRRLNVAGPRASQEPEIASFVRNVLRQAFLQ